MPQFGTSNVQARNQRDAQRQVVRLPEGLRAVYLDALDTASSWESWDRLRNVSRLSIRGAKRVVIRTLQALCDDAARSGVSDGAGR